MIEKALQTPNGLFWYISPTYRQSKAIAWRMLVAQYYNLPRTLRGEKNESELWVEINGARIVLKGADSEDSLRGSGLDGLVIDEVASITNFKSLWEEVLRPALTDKKGWTWMISTPKGFNFFYEYWLKGQPGPQKEEEYKSWQFTSYDNPHLDRNEIDKAKKELTEDSFAQEFCADWRKHVGLVYKEFDRKVHIIEPFELPSFWQFYRAMDFGSTNPTVCLWIAINSNDEAYIIDEYYQTGKTTAFHAGIILAKTKHNIFTTWGDPSGNQAMLDYAQYGVMISPALKIFNEGEEWVNSGIDKVRQLLKINSQTGKPKLYIFNNCINTIKEFETYAWYENKSIINDREIPIKQHDHCLDALRYFVGSFQARNYAQYQPEPEIKTNIFTSYHNR